MEAIAYVKSIDHIEQERHTASVNVIIESLNEMGKLIAKRGV